MTNPESPAYELSEHLRRLSVERTLAELHGLSADGAYMADLEDEIRDTNAAYVGAAVTEIASLRGQLSGPLLG